MNNIQKMLYSPEIKEKLHIKSKDIPLSQEQKDKLAKSYFKMYFGLSCLNWTQNKKLGAAWQSSIDQMKTFIDSKDEKQPATKFLKMVHEEHKTNWPKHIMTHPQRDAMLSGTPDERAQWRAYAQNQIQSAMAEITMITNQVQVKSDKYEQKPQQPKSAQVPQTKNGATAPAKPGVNSTTAPAQKPGTNSSQAALKQQAPQPGIAAAEEAKRQAMAKTGTPTTSADAVQAKELLARPDVQKASDLKAAQQKVAQMQQMRQMQIWIIQQKMQHAA